MKLSTKLFWSAGPILLAVFLFFYFAASRILLDGFEAVEARQARLDSARATQFIEQRAAQLLTSATDWGTWTPSYEFVQGKRESFAENNLIPASFTALKINAMLFLNNQREIVWAGRLSDDQENIVAAPDDLISLAKTSDLFAPDRVENASVSGIVRLNGGLMIVAATRMRNSEGGGPSQGVILLGQSLTQKIMEDIASELRMEIYFKDYEEPVPHEIPDAARDAMAHGSNFYWEIASPNEAHAYQALLDIAGRPVTEMHIHLGRDSYQQGLRTFRLFAMLLLSIGALGIFILAQMQHRFILNPLNTLEKEVKKAAIASAKTPVVELPGTSDEFVALSASITESLQREWRAHQAVRKSQQQYEILFNSMLTGFAVHEMIYDENGRATDYRFLSVNPAFERITGLSASALIGRTVREIMPDVEALWIERYAHVAETGEAVTFEAFNGHLNKHFEVSAFRPEPGQFATLFSDITARVKTNALLNLQSTALQSTANAIVITNANGVIEWVNNAFTKITGYSREEAIGQTPGALVKSGHQDKQFYDHFWATISSGANWHGELVNRRKDGKLFTEEMTVTPVRNEEGVITHFVAVEMDITQQKQLHAQLLQAQRLESIGRLASGLAHDINNILTPILIAPPILRDAITDPDALGIVDSIETSAQRGADIIKQLLAFGRGTSDKLTPVSLRALAREMLNIMEGTFPKNILIRTHFPADTALVHGDPTQLHQVLMNLCVNARDAMPNGGTLTLTLERVQIEQTRLQRYPDLKPGPFIQFTVADTGSGIPAENLEKIFEPFFTTKPTGEGTGLGLAILLTIVRGHKGFVHVESAPDKGTSFRVLLPALDTPARTHAESPQPSPPQGRGETILLVDDEAQIRTIAHRILNKSGYIIRQAPTAQDALEILRSPDPAPSAIITDITMPGMDGIALIRKIREREKDIPIIATSGNALTTAQQAELARLTKYFLAKPFTAAEILAILHSAIHRA